MRYATYVHPRFDLIFELCRVFPIESSQSKTHEQRSVSMSSTGHRLWLYDSSQSRSSVAEKSNLIQAMIKSENLASRRSRSRSLVSQNDVL